MHSDGSCDIDYDDGDKEENVAPRFVKSVCDRSMAERGSALMLVQPTALAAAKLSQKLYIPTALVHERLLAGLGELRTVAVHARARARVHVACVLKRYSLHVFE